MKKPENLPTISKVRGLLKTYRKPDPGVSSVSLAEARDLRVAIACNGSDFAHARLLRVVEGFEQNERARAAVLDLMRKLDSDDLRESVEPRTLKVLEETICILAGVHFAEELER